MNCHIHKNNTIHSLRHCYGVHLMATGVHLRAIQQEMGLTAILPTHSRRLSFHPHVHIIIPGGCVLCARRQWKKRRGRHLFHEINPAKVFRARLLEAIGQAGFYLPKDLPEQWVVHCKRVGKGLPALQYLSRYLYRGVICEHNIIEDDGTYVTFRYRDCVKPTP